MPLNDKKARNAEGSSISGIHLTIILTALERKSKFAHIAAFQIKGRMNISVESDVDIRMAEDFTQSLNIKADLYTAGGKRMASGMKVGITDTSFQNVLFKSVLHRAWLSIFVLIS